jgi:flagellar hook-basal body complex protein FliE
VSIESIAFLPPVGAVDRVATAAVAPATGTESAKGFAEVFSNGLDALNKQLVASQSDLQGVALGESQSLHQVMIRLEETRLAFQLAAQVRNRLLEAYQDVMRMQV